MADMSALVARREVIYGNLQAIYDFVSAANMSQFDAAAVKQQRICRLIAQWEHIQKEIIDHNANCDKSQVISYNQEEVAFFDLVDAAELIFRKMYNSRYNNQVQRVPEQVTAAGPSPKLKHIELPTFGGKVAEWQNFKGIFDSLVHSSGLPPVQKLQHLRSCLCDAASQLISHLDLTDASYDLAYKILCDRYDAPRLLATHHLNVLLKYEVGNLGTYGNLQKYYSTHFSSVQAYKSLNVNDKFDYLLFHICYDHLDKATQSAFDRDHPVSEFPTYEDLMRFMSDKLQTAELHSDGRVSKEEKKSPRLPRRSVNVSNVPAKADCKLACGESHKLEKCPKFIATDVNKRRDILRKYALCFLCFQPHQRAQCKAAVKCSLCQGKHNTLLHLNLEPDVSQRRESVVESATVNLTNVSGAAAEPQKVTNVAGVAADPQNVAHTNPRPILLGTARGFLKDKHGRYQRVRMLLDSGSQVCCISAKCCEKLGLNIAHNGVGLTGIGNQPSEILGNAECAISSYKSGYSSLKCCALVLPEICAKIPSIPVMLDVNDTRFVGHRLADVNWNEPGEIDFLLGADLYVDVLLNRPVIRGHPSGMHTIFGVVLLGEVPAANVGGTYQSMLTGVNSALDVALTKFWQTEEVACTKPPAPDDVYCEKLFVETTSRTDDGRYVVKLPLKEPQSHGSNRHEAEKRFLALERRLGRDEKLKGDYVAFLQEYEELGHMEVASNAADYVIPHHAVFKSTSSTTKTRVVFDGSAKDSMNLSLNDRLCTGPNLTQNITIMISGFRLYNVAVTADLRMMYRQVLVHPADRIHQHIFWRKSPTDDMQEYELNTVTYGLAPSAYLAQRALRQLVADEGTDYPLASAAILKQSYVDDICAGASSEEEAVALYRELTDLLSRGGFFPRKWSSSSEFVLQEIPEEHCETPMNLSEDGDKSIKVLGLQWDPARDAFMYTIGEFSGCITKRNVLSYVARIFDPLGWVSPCVFWVKYFLQRLWLEGLGWDDPLPPEMSRDWELFISDIVHLKHVQVPRFAPAMQCAGLYIVGFCDASTKGYAAVIYLRASLFENVTVSLLQAKSRVAPLKTLSVPRLELEAALLLAKMLKSLKDFLVRLPAYGVRLYSDSSVVLAWLRTQPHLLKTYVANRVVAINDIVTPAVWRHVPTNINAADCASRGLMGSELVEHPLWWGGPPFMKEPVSEWPDEAKGPDESLMDLELRVQVSALNVIPQNCLVADFERISSFSKLVRVYAYVMRFCKRSAVRPKGPISVNELNDAEIVVCRLAQMKDFSAEIDLVKSGRGHLSSLKALTPYVDQSGLLRVGGRLSQSGLADRPKHPILIPKNSHLAKLIVEYYHATLLHAGPLAMRAHIQQRFWIPGIGFLVRSVQFKCTKCYRFKAKTLEPPMADLPSSRFCTLRAFLNVGCDFAGPLTVKESRRRNARTYKVWVCVFVCFATKAMHLEVVTEISTDAFMAAFDRFIARRGLCARIQTDNGTNFVGAARQLKEVYDFLKNSTDVVAERLAQRKIEWVFNPPASPHFGGIHEAAVKSMKFHLYRVAGTNVFTFEELCTVLCRIEAICNSRPLCGTVCKTPDDDVEFLSPGHFLIGSTMVSAPEVDLKDVSVNRLDRWQMIKQNVQRFWKVWSAAYLQSLMPRKKWTDPCSSLSVGDTVLVKGLAFSPLNWPVGRIVDLYPGKDGISRVARIKVNGTILVRPLVSLVKFPSEQQGYSSG